MAILKVARLGHPILRQMAEAIPPGDIGSPEVQRLVDDLIETMREYDGAGLAAPQVHVSRRVVVFEVPANPEDQQNPEVPLTVLINPEVTPATETMEEGWEGCLSVPGLRGLVPRYTAVRVEACDRRGKTLRFTAEGFHARVVQHECDHLLGTVYLDRMRDMVSLSFLEEFVRYRAAERDGE